VVDAVSLAVEAVSVTEREDVEVAVVDYQLGDRSGLWVSRKLKRMARPRRVVIYSAYYAGVLAAAVVAEADGLMSKGGLGSELCDPVRSVARGRSSMPRVPWRFAEVLRQRFDAEEQAIFAMLAAGIARVEIARTLRISESRLESRRWGMLRTLEAIDVKVAIPDRGRARSAVRARRFAVGVPAG